MIKSRDVVSKQIFKLAMAGVAASCIGAAVIAAPLSATPKAELISASHDDLGRPINYAPLASGPAVQLGRAGAGEDEDCVKVSNITGSDGRSYPTRGMICAE